MKGIISRVVSVKLENFRGFKVPKGNEGRVIDTDADIVLLSGPNGYGKTSFLEALLLALTGWYDVATDPDRNPQDFVQRALVSHGAEEFKVECRVRLDLEEEQKEGVLRVTLDCDEKGTLRMPNLPVPSRLTPESEVNGGAVSLQSRELDARLTGFFQGRVDRLFDQAATGRTFRDVLDPLPPVVHAFDNPQLWSEMKDAVRRARSDGWFSETLEPPAEQRRAELRLAWRGVRLVLVRVAELLQWNVSIPEEISDEGRLDEFAKNLAGVTSSYQTLREDFERHIGRELAQAIKRAEQHAHRDLRRVEELQAQVDEGKERIRQIDEAFPNLEQDLSLFASSNDLPDALRIFRSLEHHAEGWARAKVPDDRLARVREEFAKVSAVDAGKCARALEDFVCPRREAKEKRDKLEALVRELKREQDRAVKSQELARLRQGQSDLWEPLTSLMKAWGRCHEAHQHEQREKERMRAVQMLSELEDALDACARKVAEVAAPDESTLQYLGERVQAVMGRFSMVSGCLPVSLEGRTDSQTKSQKVHLVLADGRRLEHLSSGQKAQAALALLVAQNQAAAEYMAHRVILLDDITTDYDLSNLSRQALLIRQLAYGENAPVDRRQVFLSSHHEDMTNQILDLLAPPHGRSMKVVRFLDWSTKTGPKYEVFDVEPSASVDAGLLAKDLGAF